jgi:hypothetical protein
MTIDGQSDATIRAILTDTRRIAVVGASDKAWRPSYGVFGFLLSRGYDATPVNPLLAGRAIHGRSVVARLEDAAPLEMVDVFRASANAGRSGRGDPPRRTHGLVAARCGGRGGRRAGTGSRYHRGDGPLPGDRSPAARPGAPLKQRRREATSQATEPGGCPDDQ